MKGRIVRVSKKFYAELASRLQTKERAISNRGEIVLITPMGKYLFFNYKRK